MDPAKPFPWSVISVTGPAARKMYCPRRCIEGNNVQVISQMYNEGNSICSKCHLGEAVCSQVKH
jgi:hypothetical protein